MPVEAPLGTEARWSDWSDSVMSTSTVGFPRESMISRPCTLAMVLAARREPARATGPRREKPHTPSNYR